MMTSNVLYTDRYRNLTAAQLVSAKGTLTKHYDEASTQVEAFGSLIRSGADGTAKLKKTLSAHVAAKVEAETAIAAIDSLLFE